MVANQKRDTPDAGLKATMKTAKFAAWVAQFPDVAVGRHYCGAKYAGTGPGPKGPKGPMGPPMGPKDPMEPMGPFGLIESFLCLPFVFYLG